MFAVSTKYNEAAKGLKNLDITSEPSDVGEWISPPTFIPLSEAPENMMCTSLESWLIRIKPTLKKGARAYQDTKR